MFWSVVRELNRGTNIEISDIPKEQISISAFLPRNKNVSLRTGEYTWGNRWNTCVKTVMVRYNENQREKNISPLKGVLPQNVLFTLMTLTDSI